MSKENHKRYQYLNTKPTEELIEIIRDLQLENLTLKKGLRDIQRIVSELKGARNLGFKFEGE